MPIDAGEPSFLEPSASFVPSSLTGRVVVPSPPPFVPDDESEGRAQCPHCRRLTPAADAGLTHCTECRSPLFFSDEGELMDLAVHAASLPRRPQCSECGFSGECFAEKRDDHLVCRRCGSAVQATEQAADGFQFHRPPGGAPATN